MNTYRITSVEDTRFADFLSVYSVSFPIYEQRTSEQHKKALASSNYIVQCYEREGAFLGFVVYWIFADYIYIEHLAIHPEQRGKSFGSLILKQFIAQHKLRVLLEIDPLNDCKSIKRYEFYKKVGFIMNEHIHTHPAYREGYEDHELLVLTTQEKITEYEYSRFYTDLKYVVMGKT